MTRTIRNARFLRVVWWSAFALALLVPFAEARAAGSPCSGMAIQIEPGGVLDEGTIWRAHDQVYTEGAATSWAVAKRCSNNQAACTSDNDCSGGSCVATCDCDADSSCELTGPVHQRHCLNNFAECSTNADCPSSAACVAYLGPPLPVVYDSSPTCVATHFEGAASGTFDSASGDLSISANLRRRYYLGSALDQPCPRCGGPDQNPEVGGEFTCEGGQFPGAPCIVEGVTPDFGGTSTDCPPVAGALINGSGTLIPIRDIGTDTKSKQAMLPCAAIGFTANPLVPGSNPKCTDDTGGAVCASNADCRRCTGDPTTKCSNQGDCNGKGSCAEAPDQPVTCGFWCHCGFCNNNGSSPCFDSSDCSEGETCQKGTGTSGQANQAQQKPNDCSLDGYVCGQVADEHCKTNQRGQCSLERFRSCTTNNDCQNFAAGDCVLEGRPCFESGITREGAPSPLGSYCAFEDKACTSNADCTIGGDFCVASSARPALSALYCMPGTTSTAVNSALGFPGPGAASMAAFARVCRCVGNEPGCADVCGGGPAPDCGNLVVEEGEACDGGPCCNENCTLRGSTVTCRGSAGSCDIAESCNGVSATCPADAFAASSTTCRASNGVCDAAENCSGAAASCPADTFAATSTTCRASAGACDKAESCSGSGAACPADVPETNGTPCDDGDACTASDECQGGACTGAPICGGECGDGTLDEGEACDDANATFTSGEYCGVGCVLIPCGKPTNSSGALPKSSDALFILRTAVGQTTCSPRVCSPDGNQSIVSSDALRVLRVAVGQAVTLNCPTE